MTDYRLRWLEACRLLARTTRKLEAEWDRKAPEGEQTSDGWCWAEAQAGRNYLDHHADELESALLEMRSA
ncbi:MAG: hypothetical protein ABWY51_08585 [Gaiellaceae bacterium]